MIYNGSTNKEVFIQKIGGMIWKISQEEIFIQIKKNKTLLSVLFELATEKDIEMKKYCFDILFSLFSNCIRLAESLKRMIFVHGDQ